MSGFDDPGCPDGVSLIIMQSKKEDTKKRGHNVCPGVPVELALLSILAAFGVAFGVKEDIQTKKTFKFRHCPFRCLPQPQTSILKISLETTPLRESSPTNLLQSLFFWQGLFGVFIQSVNSKSSDNTSILIWRAQKSYGLI